MTADSGKARLVMDLRSAGIADTTVLAAFERVPRERFMPPVFAARAYDDVDLPISQGQIITRPRTVARMVSALAPSRRHKVLEVGTGSGYQTAILALLSRRVYTIERYRSLRAEAEAQWAAMRLHNIVSVAGDGSRGWPRQAPFDRIIVAASVEDYPPLLMDQLAVEGIMLVPLGTSRQPQILMRVVRHREGYDTEEVGEVNFPPLIEGPVPDEALAGSA